MATANGQDVLELTLTMPRQGCWVADLLVADDQALAGAVTISINDGAFVLSGTAKRSGVFAQSNHVRVVGGAGGMSATAVPRDYKGADVRIVLGDLLAAAGERLSATADATVLALDIGAWTTTAIPVRTQLAQLLAAAAPGATWRSLADGTIWVGRETWPDAGVDPETYRVLEDNADRGDMLIAVDAISLVPGVTFEGRKVSRVDHAMPSNGGFVSTRVWFESAAPAAGDRLKAAIARLVRDVVPGFDYRSHYLAAVYQDGFQPGAGDTTGQGTVDVVPDAVNGQQLLPSEMLRVPMYLLPGMTLEGLAGGRTIIGWTATPASSSSSSRGIGPYAFGFDTETSVNVVIWEVVEQLFLGGQLGAEPPIKGISFNTAFAAFLGALGVYVAGIATIADPTDLFTTTMGAAITKLVEALPATLAKKVSVS